MMVGLKTRRANELLLRELVELATRHAEAFHRANRSALPVHRLGVFYRPDRVSDTIVIVGADALAHGMYVSCGSAAAAYAGWQRSMGNASNVKLSLVRAGEWHAAAFTPGARVKLWDPATELPRQRMHAHG